MLIVLWYIFLGSCVYLFQKETKCFSQWNTFTFFLIFLLLFHGIYVPFILNYYDFLSDSVLINFIAGLVFMYIFLLVGVWIINLIYKFNPSHIEEKVIILRKGFNPLFFWSVFLLVLGLLVYRFISAEKLLTLFDFIWRTKTAEEYRQTRILFSESITGERGGLFYFTNILSSVATPFFIYLFYFIKSKTKKPVYGVLFWGLLSLFLYQGLISGHKGTALFLLTGLFVCYSIKNKKSISFNIFNKKLVIFGTFLFLVVMPYLYMVQYPELNYDRAIYSTWSRMTIEPNRVLQLYYHIYPEKHPYLFGASSGWVAKSLGYEELPPCAYIPREFGAEGNWNVVFIGDAWADFGFAGIILSSLVVGMLLQWYNIWFIKSKKTALVLATYVALIVASYRLVSVGLGAGFLTFGVLSSFILYVTLSEMRWLKRR